MLAASNHSLHKMASNRLAVIEAFPSEDRAKDVNSVDLFIEDLPIQRSVGLLWNMRTDTFMFQIEDNQKPFTRRGVLSTVNSLYDPLGFLAPITVHGRLVLRELTAQAEDWDSPLPKDMEIEWARWKQSLQDLEALQISRPYTSFSTAGALRRELCVFADASVKAIGVVAYIKVISHQEQTEIGFIFRKAKLAPQPGLTSPRLELCAAVLAVEIAVMIVTEMDTTFDNITYYTDSKVVLGYIHNQTRRFYVYVHNRIQRIHQSRCPGQWKYVSTHLNPANIGSRTATAALLNSTAWLKGPAFLHAASLHSSERQETHNLIDPDIDPEVRPQVLTSLTRVTRDVIHPQRFERFSKFSTLLTAIAHLIHVACSFAHSTQDRCRGWHICCATLLVSHYHETVKHQGRHLTEGAIHAAGFWLVGGKHCISSLLYSVSLVESSGERPNISRWQLCQQNGYK